MTQCLLTQWKIITSFHSLSEELLLSITAFCSTADTPEMIKTQQICMTY